MMSAPAPAEAVWADARAYEDYIGIWSRAVAPQFAAWLAVAPGSRWLDVGCGTGTVAEALLEAGAGHMTGIDQSPAYLAFARARLPKRDVTLLQGHAACIELADGAVDGAAAGLLLNFLSLPSDAVREMARVVRPGGTVAAYVWDYAGRMDLLRRFWDVAVRLRPEVRAHDEGFRSTLCSPGPLSALFSNAGLIDVLTCSFEADRAFAGFDAYWEPFLGGQGTAGRYVASLDDRERIALREALRAELGPGGGPPIVLGARAWAVKGTRPLRARRSRQTCT
jgi:SAM-dependent methyltransferase